MENKRQFTRWSLEKNKRATVTCGKVTEEVTIRDISAGGMLVSSRHPLKDGNIIYGQFEVLGPYFVKGKITRSVESKGEWYTAVSFEKISTIPLQS